MIRYNAVAIFCSTGEPAQEQFASGSILQLSRAQSQGLEIIYPRENIDYLNQNTSQVIVEQPVVELDITWLATNGNNERAIGLVTDGYNSAFYKLNQEKNYYIVIAEESDDINYDTGNVLKGCFGVGNAVLNRYTVSASVGGFVETQVNLQGLNVVFYSGVSGFDNPGIDSNGDPYPNVFNVPYATTQTFEFSLNSANDVTALSYKDVMMEFPSDSVFATYMTGTNACHLQNFNLSFSVNRETVPRFGKVTADRLVEYPIDVSLSVEAYVDKYKADKLRNKICPDSGHNINIIIKQPCSDYLALEYYLRGLKLESQSFNTTIGEYTIVNFNWRGRIGGNLSESGTNFYIRAEGGTEQYIVDFYKDVQSHDQYGNPVFDQEVYFKRVLIENFFTPSGY